MDKENVRAKLDLQEGLRKFKEDTIKRGWEEDEVQEKITEVFTNFPFYKFSSKPKTSWKARIGKFLLYSLILYLAYTALLERNRRIRKTVYDFYHDHEFTYHYLRILRFLTLPVFKIYDLSKLHQEHCVIPNPFRKKSEPHCDLCEKLSEIKPIPYDENTKTVIESFQPAVVHGVPGYVDANVGFHDFKRLFELHHKDLDEAICKIWLNKNYQLMSEYFRLSEQEILEKNISIAWCNCHTYGTRFYRKLFPRAKFIPSAAEVSLEKIVMILQKEQNVTMEEPSQGDYHYQYIAQVKGTSLISIHRPEDCADSCPKDSMTTTIHEGELFVFPATFWDATIKAVQDEGLNIIYQSSYS